ncbi:Cyclin-L2 [Armadillidium nasatum]|uniref:Cyclin-L2 n=1 Tax=Armadillidium nasatum TaxID=96803 RepID=A0A5N5TA17_9CRUS|nr:Cyclin-L2 [Armadillidium nasatum]
MYNFLANYMNFMNDSLRTDVCVRYSPETIACSCIWLAGRQLKIPLPENPPWYHVFGVNLSDIEKIAASIMKLYTRKKTKLKVLETKVEEVRLKLQEARLRKKAVSDVVSSEEASSFSSASGSSSPSNNSSLSKSSSSSESSSLSTSSSSSKSISPSKNSSSSKSNSSSKSSSPSECNATSSRRRKRSCSERRKSNGSSRSKSRSPSRRARKKAKRSHKRSISRSRSRSHSRERYYKKKYSRSPSLAVTPRPQKEGLFHDPDYVQEVLTQSMTRNTRKNVANKMIATTNWRRHDKHYKYVKDFKEKYSKDYRRYDHKDKYSSKYLEKLDKNNKRKMKNRYYESDYERHHRSKVNGRRRSRSKEREIRKG